MNKLLKQNAILLGLLLTTILGTLMPGLIIDIPFLDKIIHFGVFFALSMSLFLRFAPYSGLEVLLLWALLGGLLMEFVQQFIPDRSAEVNDVMANVLGCITAWWLYKSSFRLVAKQVLR